MRRLLADQSRGQSRFARKTVVRLGFDIVQELLERRAAAVPLRFGWKATVHKR